MVDIYAATVVGIALIISVVPPLIMYLKSDRKGWLVQYHLDKSLMTQEEIDECEKLGKVAFMEKIEKEIKEKRENDKWRKKRR